MQDTFFVFYFMTSSSEKIELTSAWPNRHDICLKAKINYNILSTNNFNQSCFSFAVLMRTNKQGFGKWSWLNYLNDQDIPVSILVSTKSLLD